MTISRVLGLAVNVEEFEYLPAAFFSSLSEAGQSVLVTIAGKTIKSTIPWGETRGQHLLAVLLP